MSTGGGGEPLWSPDGRRLYYRVGAAADGRDRGRVTLAGGHAGATRCSRDRSRPSPWHPNYDVMPDGKSFVMLRPVEEHRQLVMVLNWIEELRRRTPRGTDAIDTSAASRPRSPTATASSASSGQGGMATVYLAARPEARPQGRHQGPAPRAGRRPRRRAIPARDQDHAPTCSIRTSCRCIDSGEADGYRLLRHAVRRGRVAARPAGPREAAPGRRRAAHRDAKSPARSTTPTATA